jgi:hypothetical protein
MAVSAFRNSDRTSGSSESQSAVFSSLFVLCRFPPSSTSSLSLSVEMLEVFFDERESLRFTSGSCRMHDVKIRS